ncbi:MAG: VOC family protein [Thermoplasmata archaeon]|nr:VOC family protein [Thermoplasmata archaeon]
MTGKVVHFEVPADNVERARKFYQSTFNWTISPMPEMEYTMVATGPGNEDGSPKEPGYIGGGIAKRGPTVGQPVITIHVDDIDAALAKIQKNGGSTVSPKAPIGPMGFVAYFKDSEGNTMGLWQLAPEA